jgi:hypothetical protein
VGSDWKSGDFFLQMNTELGNLRFMLLNTSDHSIAPTEITVRQTSELNGGKVNFTFNVVLVSTDVAPYEADYTAGVKVQKNNSYAPTAFDITSVIAAAFQKTPDEIAAAISDKSLEFYALNADDTQKPSTANYPGHWFDASGNTASWGATAVLFAEMGVENEKVLLNIGNYPDCAAANVTFKQVVKLNGGQVNLTFTVDLINP